MLCVCQPLSYPSCSGARAPGLAADMHFRDNVIAFIGPACAFALEPVARLAAYWNTPIITGMGDQVSFKASKNHHESHKDRRFFCFNQWRMCLSIFMRVRNASTSSK